jgi:hypothetical protein
MKIPLIFETVRQQGEAFFERLQPAFVPLSNP